MLLRYFCFLNSITEKNSKRVDLGTVIAATQFSIDVLKKFLNFLGGSKRKIAIGVSNNTPYKWKGTGVYFNSGTSDIHLPRYVNPKQAAIYTARKKSRFFGVEGVLCYYIPARHKSLCVMFSVPNHYVFHSNWWDAEVFTGKIQPDKNYFKHMYKGKPQKGNNR